MELDSPIELENDRGEELDSPISVRVDSDKSGNDKGYDWIPAFARMTEGMTIVSLFLLTPPFRNVLTT